MATGQFRRSGADPASKADSKNTDSTVDSGPYEAVVVSHVVGTRMGQLMVYIPDFGGEKTDPNNQIPVSYCSPYYGTTYNTDSQDSSSDAPDAQFITGQSYGMWMVPPDVGNKVLVVFAAGDRKRGYWIGCIYDSMSHHMVPGLARNISSDKSKTLPPNPADDLTSALNSNSVSPVVEAYTGDASSFTPDGITSTPRYVHEYQNIILVGQGLDQDPVRGAISSSSLRESPSNVYGISTPGRSMTGNKPQVSAAPGENATQAVIARQGGHSFVMDDGDVAGVDRLIRLRSSGGHQVLMNDTEGIFYIASASGNQWIEFGSNGQINIFADAGFNVRTKGDLNLHSDAKLNINSNDTVNISGANGVKISSPQTIDIQALSSLTAGTNGKIKLFGGGGASLLSGGGLSMSSNGPATIAGQSINLGGGSGNPPSATMPTMNSLPDVSFNGTNWTASGSISSICTIAPAHEPWKR